MEVILVDRLKTRRRQWLGYVSRNGLRYIQTTSELVESHEESSKRLGDCLPLS